jgi:hypothetical protein
VLVYFVALVKGGSDIYIYFGFDPSLTSAKKKNTSTVVYMKAITICVSP